MIELPYISDTTPFPPVDNALSEPEGLLAFGGDLSVFRLFNAYSNGIFPWFSEDEPILWWSPTPRAIIRLEDFHVSRSLKKLATKQSYRVTLNKAFDAVIQACATIPRKHPSSSALSHETWISKEMIQAYTTLHHKGLAHSVEVWSVEGKLVGGLYGVGIGKVYCGESTFHKHPNASKLAMMALVRHMQAKGMAFIDCQLPTEHLTSLGAHALIRKDFIKLLRENGQTLNDQGELSQAYRGYWQSGNITP